MSHDIEKRFCRNFRIWVDKHYPRQERLLADKLGISTPQLNNIKHGRRSGTESWRRWVAEQLGLDYDEMIGVDRSVADTQNAVIRVVGSEEAALEENAGYRVVPLHETGLLTRGLSRLSFGKNTKSQSAVVISHSGLRERAGHEMRALRITDDSMWPRAPEGSVVFVDLDDRRFVDDRLYVVVSPSMETPTGVLRRVRKVSREGNPEGYVLISENRRYLPEMTDLSWEDMVVGRAVWIWRDLEGAQPEPQHQQYQRGRKIESLEWLIAGVAYQLNNVLSPIMGYGEMALANAEGSEELTGQIKEMMDASVRAQSLGRQLLAFGRQRVQEFSSLDIDELLRNAEYLLLRPMLPGNVRLHLRLGGITQTVRGDEDQLEQVVVSLVNNALDAMPEGGDLTIRTSSAKFDEDYAGQRQSMKPGRYVLISVSDTGAGMDEDTLECVFEPFFTTKSKNVGAGLGLSNAYGIIKQHEGNIWAYSKPGAGTTIEIYLPVESEGVTVAPTVTPTVKAVTDSGEEASAEKQVSAPDAGEGRATILLVEDEPVVRRMCTVMLGKQGYNVLVAKNGAEAVSVVDQHEGPVHILLLDVILPGVHGGEVYQQVSGRYPGVAALYMSAYAKNVLVHHGILGPDVDFIQKPFKGAELVSRIEEKLQGAKNNI